MQGCTPEWRTNFQREATTRDSKRGQRRNTVIQDPKILCTPLSKFLDPPLIMVVRCELKIPSLGITVRHHSASLLMPNSYPRDGIFNQHLTIIKDSYSFVHRLLTDNFSTGTIRVIDCRYYSGFYGRQWYQRQNHQWYH